MEVPATPSSATEGNCDSHQVSCFKNIPIRLYEGDKSMIQKLIKPTINATNTTASQKVYKLDFDFLKLRVCASTGK